MPDKYNNIADDFESFRTINKLAEDAAKKYNLDPALLRAQIQQESGFRSGAQSPKGAQGVMQLMPATAAELGVTNPNDPAQNIDGGARYMRQLLDRYKGDHKTALMAYNAGMGNVDKGRAASFPETQQYVSRIMGNQAKWHAPKGAGVPVPPQAPPEDIGADFESFRQQQSQEVPVHMQDKGWARNAVNAFKANPVDALVNSLPAIGGTVGGIVGGAGGGLPTFGLGAAPGAIVGAATFAAGGEALKQTINRFRGKDAPATSMDAAKAIGTEGALGAAGEFIPRALMSVGRGFVHRAIGGPALKYATKDPKAIQQIVQTTIADGLGVSGRGAAKAKRGTDAATLAHDAMVSKGQAAGAPPVRTANVFDDMHNRKGWGVQGKDSMLEWVNAQSNPQPFWTALNKFEQQFSDAHGSSYLPLKALDLKRNAAAAAKEGGAFVKDRATTFDAALEAAASKAQQAGLESSIGPKLAAADAVTQKKLLAQLAIEKRIADLAASGPKGFLTRHLPAVALGGIAAVPGAAGVALPAAVMAEILGNPRIMAALGRGTYKSAPLARGAVRGAQVGQAQQPEQRPLTKDELDAQYQAFLERNK